MAAVFGAGGRGACASLAPLVGSTPISLRRVFDSLDSVRGQHRRADFLRRAAAARARGRAWSGRRSPRRASCFRRCCATRSRRRSRLASPPARRLGAMLALTFDLPSGIAGFSAVPIASFAGSLGAVAIVYALARATPPGAVDQRAAARRRHAELVFLGADSLRAVSRRLHADVPHGPLADGRSRRRAATRRSSPPCRRSRSRSPPSPCCRAR